MKKSVLILIIIGILVSIIWILDGQQQRRYASLRKGYTYFVMADYERAFHVFSEYLDIPEWSPFWVAVGWANGSDSVFSYEQVQNKAYECLDKLKEE